MAHQKSAKKKIRHDEKRRVINRRNKGILRTQLKKYRKAVASDNTENLKGILQETLSIIDKSIQKKIIHHNTASRLKSRLTKSYNKAVGASSPVSGEEKSE